MVFVSFLMHYSFLSPTVEVFRCSYIPYSNCFSIRKNRGCDFLVSVIKQHITNRFLGKDYLCCTGFIFHVLGLWDLSLGDGLLNLFTSVLIMEITNNYQVLIKIYAHHCSHCRRI